MLMSNLNGNHSTAAGRILVWSCGRFFFHPASDGAAERFRTTKTGPTRQKELSARSFPLPTLSLWGFSLSSSIRQRLLAPTALISGYRRRKISESERTCILAPGYRHALLESGEASGGRGRGAGKLRNQIRGSEPDINNLCNFFCALWNPVGESADLFTVEGSLLEVKTHICKSN